MLVLEGVEVILGSLEGVEDWSVKIILYSLEGAEVIVGNMKGVKVILGRLVSVENTVF